MTEVAGVVDALPLAVEGASFPSFYASRWGSLVTLAAAITLDRAAASDIAQEAMTRVYARWGLLRDPFPWSLRVTRNLAIDAVRRRSREVPVDSVPEAAASVVDSPVVLDAVLALPAAQRDVILLHYLLDLPVATVATITRRPVGTVKRRLHDARAALALTLGDIDD